MKNPLPFPLVFHAVGTLPTNAGTYLLYNQCDGYHLVDAWFDDGEFQFFHFWMNRSPITDDFYVAWAELPDTVGSLFSHFSRSLSLGLGA